MKKLTLLLPLISIIFIYTMGAFAQSNEGDVTASRIDKSIPDMLQKNDIPEASITYIKDGKVILNKGYGVKNKILQTKTDGDTVYEVASNGKLIASYICMKLAAEGKINIDEPIIDYVKNAWIKDGAMSGKITARQLLSHTSGLSNSIFPLDMKVHFKPGSSFSYSGVGFIYLQKVIEDITGKPFEEVAKQYVFSPLKMKSSSFTKPAYTRSGTANPHMSIKSVSLYIITSFLIFFIIIYLIGFITGVATRFSKYSKSGLFKIGFLLSYLIELITIFIAYSKLFLPLILAGIAFSLIFLVLKFITGKYYIAVAVTFVIFIAAPFILQFSLPLGNDMFPSSANAAFTLKSTSNDLGKFSVGLLSDFRKDDGALKEMLREQVIIDKNNSWGLGFGIKKSELGEVYWHSGINPGSRSLIVINPKANEAVIVLTNGDNGLNLAADVMKIVLGIDNKWDIQEFKRSSSVVK